MRVTAVEYGLITVLIAVAIVAVGIVSNQLPMPVMPAPHFLLHRAIELRGDLSGGLRAHGQLSVLDFRGQIAWPNFDRQVTMTQR